MIAKTNERRLINSVLRTKRYSILPSKMKKQILVWFFFFLVDILNLNTQLFGPGCLLALTSWLRTKLPKYSEAKGLGRRFRDFGLASRDSRALRGPTSCRQGDRRRWGRALRVLSQFSRQGQLGLDPELKWKLPRRGIVALALMGELLFAERWPKLRLSPPHLEGQSGTWPWSHAQPPFLWSAAAAAKAAAAAVVGGGFAPIASPARRPLVMSAARTPGPGNPEASILRVSGCRALEELPCHPQTPEAALAILPCGGAGSLGAAALSSLPWPRLFSSSSENRARPGIPIAAQLQAQGLVACRRSPWEQRLRGCPGRAGQGGGSLSLAGRRAASSCVPRSHLAGPSRGLLFELWS